jgi:long-chain acyl-CoA synthetase
MEVQEITVARPWLKYYPSGVPAEINPDIYPSIGALLEESSHKFADRDAYICMGKSVTFAEIGKLSLAFGAYLQSLGLQKGDKIVLQMPNIIQYPVAMYGALRAGLTVVNTNPLYTPREMEYQFKDSDAKAIVILANFAHNLEKVINHTQIKHVIITQMGDLHDFPKKQLINFVVKNVKKLVPVYNLPGAVGFNDALSIGKKYTFKPVTVNNTDVAFIQYTGGTTGVSKGAMLSHRNVISNVEMNLAWMGSAFDPTVNGGMIVTALPLYHIYSLTVNAISALRNGGTNLLIPNPRDMKGFLKELSKYTFQTITGLNTLYNGMLNHADFNTVNWSNLKIASAGGMALQKSVCERWKSATGVLPAEGYGLSETSPVLSSNPCSGQNNKIGTIGLPFPNTYLRIVKDDGTDAQMTPEGITERGEIWAKGPQIMLGYYNRPDETAKVMEGEWFKTGDIGVMDAEGYFKIVDRKKDMILVSGFNVYPNEVEDVIALHPKVKEVAVIGVPDAKSTEAVKAFIIKKDESLTEAEIDSFCHQNLTGYKCPKFFEFREELPKTNVGKILRKALREEELAKTK